jgi:hypothetical protein
MSSIMDRDLKSIASMLKKRFPKCRIETQCADSFGPDAVVYLNFNSIDDSIAVSEKDGSVCLCVIKNANSDDFKKYGEHCECFPYQNYKHLIAKIICLTKIMLKELQKFEAEENRALKSWNIARPSTDPEIAPEFANEIKEP